jgi:hypothetical protein
MSSQRITKQGSTIDFAEFNCTACHHDLAGRESVTHAQLTWGTWTLPKNGAAEVVLRDQGVSALTQLRNQLRRRGQRAETARQMELLAQELTAKKNVNARDVLSDAAKEPEPQWDSVVQRYIVARVQNQNGRNELDASKVHEELQKRYRIPATPH